MSICSPCYDAGSYVDACLSELVYNFGLTDGTYYVWLQHNATKKIQQFEVISDGGFISFDEFKIDPLQGYTIWVTELANSQERIDLTIGEDTYTCISFSTASIGQNPIVIP